MPPRASHLPTSPERDALQKLRAGRELTPRALEPTGKRTVLNMVQGLDRAREHGRDVSDHNGGSRRLARQDTLERET
jgi:hypothetical protein